MGAVGYGRCNEIKARSKTLLFEAKNEKGYPSPFQKPLDLAVEFPYFIGGFTLAGKQDLKHVTLLEKRVFAERFVQGKLSPTQEIRKKLPPPLRCLVLLLYRAVDSDLIEYEKGGVLQVKDFERKAKEVCDNLDSYSSASPFLCMDLSYITALLKEGFGFGESTILQLAKKVNNIETSWALGATFHLLQSLGLSH
ncbi:ectonucleoside triphosphate diphosphohydrolase 5-like [Sceloporus undulatus]|uniref:ectonucleoside triphosphate diphosphohydrolase 5-like n=1 Tax=Sceloporus undulatus TaxID=8520 RepID=UPI001C4CDC21|nr:ectonucleoside triphosphate diphosphohydrolase 5-like [Sceloporus undulatus]